MQEHPPLFSLRSERSLKGTVGLMDVIDDGMSSDTQNVPLEGSWGDGGAPPGYLEEQRLSGFAGVAEITDNQISTVAMSVLLIVLHRSTNLVRNNKEGCDPLLSRSSPAILKI
jgi:hypothetical protein